MWPIRLRRTRLCVIFHAAAIADHPLVLHAAILAARAFPVLLGPKMRSQKQAVLLGAVGAVVDRLRLFHLAERPATDIVRPGETDLHRSVVVYTIVCAFADAHGKSSPIGERLLIATIISLKDTVAVTRACMHSRNLRFRFPRIKT